MQVYSNLFSKIISPQNLFEAWAEFRRGKQNKKDVAAFEYELEENIFSLYHELSTRTYQHGPYHGFYITGPKQRHIHKAPVRDRIVHHALFKVLNPIFEPGFIYDSYSCRKQKGTHRGIDRLSGMLRCVSRNDRSSCVALKCDIRKFFKSVKHDILLTLLRKKVADPEAIWLLEKVVRSLPSGLPIGNLTSQLFANIYLNELDQFTKRILGIPFYLRYTDDFVMIHESEKQLKEWLEKIRTFLKIHLNLELHPRKVILRKYHQGVDFLGYVQFPNHRLLRTKTKNRILIKIKQGASENSLQSYLGVLSHANSHKLSEKIKNDFWLNFESKKSAKERPDSKIQFSD